MKRKVWNITVKDNPNRVVMGENDEFYTTDTEAYLVFKLDDKNFNPTSAVLTLENRNDGSLKDETVDVVDGLIEWEMPQRYIEHFGNWQGQLVYEDTKDGQPELYTSAPFSFVVNAHIGDKKKPSLVEIENWEKFIRDGTELIEMWEDLEALREENERQRVLNEQGRESAESERVANEEERELNEAERISKDSERDSKIEAVEGLQADLISGAVDSAAVQQHVEERYGQLEEEYAPKLTEVNRQLAQTALGIPLASMSNVTVEENYTGVLPITFHHGWLYGFQNNTTIVRSNNDGKTWSTVAISPQGSLHSMYWTDDGEVLLGFNNSIRKSIGWSNNPQTATWKVVVTRSKGIGILPWGIDGDGTKFIVTEYSASDRSESRYVWISTDMGETFNVVVDKYEIDPDNTSHMHGVCYDRWADRFFLSHGHGIIEGVYWSDDDGATWNLVNADFELDASPTTLTATDNGIVAGSDSGRAGLYGIQRTENPHDMVMRRTARWQVSREGVTGFAYRGVRDEETGQVYVAIKSDYNDISPVIMAGTATTGSLLWEDEIGSGSSFQFLTVTDNKVIGVHGNHGAYKLIAGDKPTLGVDVFDSGNVLVGKATSTSIGIGRNVDVRTPNEIVIGHNARQETGLGTDNVIIGRNASGGSQGITIGTNSKSEGGFTTVIGNSAKASGEESIAIGYNASTQSGGTRATAIGYNADVSMPSGTAIGTSSKSTGDSGTAVGNNTSAGRQSVSLGRGAFTGNGNSVAIGKSSRSIHLDSVALGADTETTAEKQLQIGQRHIELGVAPIGAGPIGVARIYLKENPDGKQQLCVRFRNGEVVLATQP